jgi:hypothetical protein
LGRWCLAQPPIFFDSLHRSFVRHKSPFREITCKSDAARPNSRRIKKHHAGIWNFNLVVRPICFPNQRDGIAIRQWPCQFGPIGHLAAGAILRVELFFQIHARKSARAHIMSGQWRPES